MMTLFSNHRVLRPFVSGALALLLLALSIALQFQKPELFDGVRRLSFDTYMRIKPRQPADLPLAVVHIDEHSVRQLGPWPWPPETVSRLIDRLQASGAALIGLDMALQARAGGDSPGDLTGVLQGVPVVAGTALLDRDETLPRAYRKAGFALIDVPDDLTLPRLGGALEIRSDLLAGAAGVGALNVYPESDGAIRHYPLLFNLRGQLFPSFAAELLRVASGAASYAVKTTAVTGPAGHPPGMSLKIGTQVFPLDARGQVWVYFAKHSAWPVLSALDIFDRHLPEKQLVGRLVLVGVSLPGVGSTFASPSDEALSSSQLQAQVFSQLASGELLERPRWALGGEVLAGIVCALLVLGAAVLWRGMVAILIGALLISGLVLGGWYLFDTHHLLIDPLVPGLTAATVFLGVTLVNYLLSEWERRWVKVAFSRYVSPNLVEHLVRHPEKLQLSGEYRDCSFVFTDLEGFTPLVEQCEPGQLVSVINAYLEGMVAIVFDHQGTLDRVVGDAVAVMFSAPLEQPDHAARAVACAEAMDRFAQGYARSIQRQGLALGVTRIGVHSGTVIVGNFGGAGYFDYRAFGDPINTAARLETVNKLLGTRICLSEDVVQKSGYRLVRPVGNLLLKGKARAVRAYTLVSKSYPGSDLAKAYGQALASLETGDVESAVRQFEMLARRFPEDPLCSFHLQRLSRGEVGDTIRLG